MLLFPSSGNFPGQGKYIAMRPKGVLAVTSNLLFFHEQPLHPVWNTALPWNWPWQLYGTCSIVERTLDYRRDLGFPFTSAINKSYDFRKGCPLSLISLSFQWQLPCWPHGLVGRLNWDVRKTSWEAFSSMLMQGQILLFVLTPALYRDLPRYLSPVYSPLYSHYKVKRELYTVDWISQTIYCSLLWITDTMLETERRLSWELIGSGLVCQQAEVVVMAVRH